MASGARRDEPRLIAAVGLAASRGGFVALTSVLSQLSADFPAPIFLAHHRAGSTGPFLFLMKPRTALRLKEAVDGEVPIDGTVYLAPTGRHLGVDAGGAVCTCRTDRVRHVRPSADYLFETLAAHYGDRTVVVVLSGTGNDGARGVCAVQNGGGYVIAQSALTAEYSGMPSAAMATYKVDIVLPLAEIGPALTARAARGYCGERDSKGHALRSSCNR